MLRRFLELQGMLFTSSRGLPITVDAQAIPADFLDFLRRNPCSDRDCSRCGYCAAIADKAVRVEPAFLDAVLPLYAAIQRELYG